MNNKSHISREIMEIAADWCDRQETLSQGEREDFRAWIAADPLHARAFDRMRRTMLDVALIDMAEEIALEKKQPHFSWRQWGSGLFGNKAFYGVLAGAAVAACALIMFWPNARQPGMAPSHVQILATATGQRSSAVLSDKSTVYLNAATRVAVLYTQHERRLNLSQGEAIFQVSKDKVRPFRVVTGSAVVTAVGTRFGVDRVGDAVEVRVFEGTVKVESKGMAARAVTQGEWLLLDPARGLLSGLFAPAQYESWRSGWLQADRMPLAYVIARLNRYTENKIILSDPKLGTVGLNGRFRLDNTDGTLKQIAALLDLEIVKQGDRLLLTPKT